MDTLITDQQVVTGVDGLLFSMTQQSQVAALVTMANTGTNTMNYHFQQFDGNSWADLSSLGTDLNNTLSYLQVKMVAVASNYPQVRLMGYASGNTVLDFAVDRYIERPSGGTVPLLNL